MRQQTHLHRRGDEPELQRRFFEEDDRLARAALRFEPVTDFEDAFDSEGVDGFVGLEVSATKTDEQWDAEGDEDERQPEPAQPQALMQVTSDQILGMLIFSMDTGLRSA